MRPRLELGVQAPDGGQDRTDLHDRVQTEVRPRAVRGPARDLDLEPDKALVRYHELQLGGLGDDRRVGAYHAEDLLDSEARMLLVGHGGDDHVACEPARRGLAAGDERRGEPSLHVVGATPVEPVAVDAWG